MRGFTNAARAFQGIVSPPMNVFSLVVRESQVFLHRLRREQRELVVEYQIVGAGVIRQRDIHVVYSNFAAVVKRGG